MGRTQKLLTTALWALMVLVMVSVIGAGLWKRDERSDLGGQAPLQTAPPVAGTELSFAVPSFSLTDQNGQGVTEQSLRGKPWVAAFIFTQCAGPCPMMSAKMAELQKRVPDAALKLVSFTVDPARDTPAVLKQYAQTLNADESRWLFLTGTEDAMMQIARGMQIAAQPATADAPILHSTKFLLVDAAGIVRGAYSSDDAGFNKLATDAAALAVGERR